MLKTWGLDSLQVGLGEKEGVVFLREEGIDTPMHTMVYTIKLFPEVSLLALSLLKGIIKNFQIVA